MWWRWTLLIAAACGRVGFDSVSGGDGGGDSGVALPTVESYFKASNTDPNDGFGQASAISADGTLVAIGGFKEASNATGVNGNQADDTFTGSGAVYLFERTGSTWAQQAYFKASNPGINDQFGFTLALAGDGHTLAVDSPLERSNATGINGDQLDNAAPSAGAVYVFTETAGAWSQEAYIKASNNEGNDQFGFALALSNDGNTLAVSSRQEDSAAAGVDANQLDNTATDSGAVYVFTRSGSTWTQQVYIKPPVVHPTDNFGYSVALSNDGNTLVVGSPFENSAAVGIDGNINDVSASASGAAYVYERAGVTWTLRGYIKASNTNAGDELGWSVAVAGDGNTFAVGAHNEASTATGVGGDQTNNGAAASGAVYVYERSGATWAQQAYVKAPNTGMGDQFGFALSLTRTGDELVVAAPKEASAATGIGGNQADGSASQSGAVYVYARAAGVWSFASYLKATNTEMSDQFGTSVAVAASSGSIVVGATFEDSAATGVGGVQASNGSLDSGAAYVFE